MRGGKRAGSGRKRVKQPRSHKKQVALTYADMQTLNALCVMLNMSASDVLRMAFIDWLKSDFVG